MKRLLLNLLCLLFAYPCFAAEPIQLARMSPWVAGSVAAAPAYTNPCPASWGGCESFNGSSSCYSGDSGNNCDNTWTITGSGTKDFKYATSPAPLEGDYSMRFDATTNYVHFEKTQTACSNECYGYALLTFDSNPAAIRPVLAFVGSSGQTLTRVSVSSTGKFVAVNNTTAGTATTLGPGTGTKTHVWWYYKAGGGADSISWVGWAPDENGTGTMPNCTENDNYCSYIGNGAATLNVNRVRGGLGDTGLAGIIDKLIWHPTSIGNQ